VTYVLLSLGSNTGDSSANLKDAIGYLDFMNSTEVVKTSSVHKTAPWGKTDQPDFLNQSVLIRTQLTVVELMENILQIEKEMGRVREEKWGPRMIDIDVILFGDKTVNSPKVVVPHPHMHERKFVLEPSVEIAAEMLHPILKKTVAELLSLCEQSIPATASR
jgi:2-amino-4-hydroxy-6-hydroxymethyldihydropteridine diphosphokinase